MTILLYFLMSAIQPAYLLFDFTAEADISDWRVVDDVVMGGRSDGHFMLNEEGLGRYFGHVSLENNGGFSSVRYRMQPQNIEAFTTLVLRIKGDAKRYQIRCKSSLREQYSYINYVETTGDWQTIKLDLESFEPAFRGRMLNMPNYPAEQLSELAILIGNKEPQDFELLIDWVGFE